MTNPYTAENEIYSVLPGVIRVKGLVFTHKIYLIVLVFCIHIFVFNSLICLTLRKKFSNINIFCLFLLALLRVSTC